MGSVLFAFSVLAVQAERCADRLRRDWRNNFRRSKQQ